MVSIIGELDVATAPALQQELLAALARGGRLLVVDASRVESIDASGIGVIVLAAKLAARRAVGSCCASPARRPEVCWSYRDSKARCRSSAAPLPEASAHLNLGPYRLAAPGGAAAPQLGKLVHDHRPRPLVLFHGARTINAVAGLESVTSTVTVSSNR